MLDQDAVLVNRLTRILLTENILTILLPQLMHYLDGIFESITIGVSIYMPE